MDALTFNMQANLELQWVEGVVTWVAVAAPVRGRPLRPVYFSRAEDPAVCAFLAKVCVHGADARSDLGPREVARLVDAGVLVPAELAPYAPRFRCDAADPPADLIPRPLTPLPAEATPLHVNESLLYDGAVGAPAEGVAPRLALLSKPDDAVNPFDAGSSWAFVDHPSAAVPGTISVPPESRALFRRLRPGAPAPNDLSPHERAVLVRAGVLVDRADEARLRAVSAEAVTHAAAALARDGHVVLPDLVHPVQIAALRRYYRALVAEGYLRLGDSQDPRRYVAYDEPLARFFHRRLTARVAAVAGEPLKPSYVFFASYLQGGGLAPHRDRAQCAYTVSLLVDYAPEPSGPSPWPLWLDPDPKGPGSRPSAVSIGLGDGLLFRGTKLWHWREPLPDGHASTSLLFHYVPASFVGPLN